MNSVNSDIKRFAHSVGQNWYHIVLIPKYRYPIFAQEHQRKIALDSIIWICKNHNIEMYANEIMDDHVYLFIYCPPNYSIRRLVRIIKGGTSYYIRKNHPPLKRYKALWSKGFMYRSVGAVSAEIVKNYIQYSNQWISSKQRKLI